MASALAIRTLTKADYCEKGTDPWPGIEEQPHLLRYSDPQWQTRLGKEVQQASLRLLLAEVGQIKPPDDQQGKCAAAGTKRTRTLEVLSKLPPARLIRRPNCDSDNSEVCWEMVPDREDALADPPKSECPTCRSKGADAIVLSGAANAQTTPIIPAARAFVERDAQTLYKVSLPIFAGICLGVFCFLFAATSIIIWVRNHQTQRRFNRYWKQLESNDAASPPRRRNSLRGKKNKLDVIANVSVKPSFKDKLWMLYCSTVLSCLADWWKFKCVLTSWKHSLARSLFRQSEEQTNSAEERLKNRMTKSLLESTEIIEVVRKVGCEEDLIMSDATTASTSHCRNAAVTQRVEIRPAKPLVRGQRTQKLIMRLGRRLRKRRLRPNVRLRRISVKESLSTRKMHDDRRESYIEEYSIPPPGFEPKAGTSENLEALLYAALAERGLTFLLE